MQIKTFYGFIRSTDNETLIIIQQNALFQLIKNNIYTKQNVFTHSLIKKIHLTKKESCLLVMVEKSIYKYWGDNTGYRNETINMKEMN